MDKSISECISLVKKIKGSGEIVDIRRNNNGVWNNIVLEVTTTKNTYYFKKYQKLSNLKNYSPPNIPAKQRARVAVTAQSLASHILINHHPLAPRILAFNDNGFLMEGLVKSKSLFEHLSSGECPELIKHNFPDALARFHNSSLNKKTFPKELKNTKFRDYKLNLQYYQMSKLLDESHGKVIKDLANRYKEAHSCIVHGDLNSRNILISGNNLRIIDFEQAHIGAPEFDLAYILSELLIASSQFRDNKNVNGICSLPGPKRAEHCYLFAS